jgi:hypothetical protein
MKRRTLLMLAAAGGAAVAGASAMATVAVTEHARHEENPMPHVSRDTLPGFRFDGATGGRTIVKTARGATAAVLTQGARVVNLPGTPRTFTESANTAAKVSSDVYAYVMPKPWYPDAQDEPWFTSWFRSNTSITQRRPLDVLTIAMQYLDGAPVLRDARNVAYAGDAGFGLLRTEDEVDGADFYDFMGIPWTWPDGSKSQPSPQWLRRLDCSGYIRMVYGYRGGLPLARGAESTEGLPRTARGMARYRDAVRIAEGDADDKAPESLNGIMPGDLLFFALHDDETTITHSGIYIGDDQNGDQRFVSSRTSQNGPTFGDFNTKSIFNTGYFRRRLRRVIRL